MSSRQWLVVLWVYAVLAVLLVAVNYSNPRVWLTVVIGIIWLVNIGLAYRGYRTAKRTEERDGTA